LVCGSDPVVLGEVSTEECEQIRSIFDRRMGLQALVRALADMPDRLSDDLYERVVQDYASVDRQMRRWWEETRKTHGWDSPAGASWSIDFNSRVVSLQAGRTADCGRRSE